MWHLKKQVIDAGNEVKLSVDNLVLTVNRILDEASDILNHIPPKPTVEEQDGLSFDELGCTKN